MSTEAGPALDQEMVITRILNAPPDAVWQIFLEREHVIHWWGPKDFFNPDVFLEPRPGGRWRIVMRSPDGKEYPQSGFYREMLRPELLSFTLMWEVEGPATEMLCTFEFADQGAETRMTFHKGPFSSAETYESEHQGWNECFDRLDEYVKSGTVSHKI